MISILAPYARCEATAAAVRIADLAQALGHEVRFVAVGRCESGVDGRWDRRIMSGKGNGVYLATRQSDVVFHFECDRDHLAAARLVADKADHILVPSWSTLTPDRVALLPEYDYVVCPSKVLCRYLQHTIFADNSASASWSPWDSGLPAVSREGTVADARVRACFVCDSAVIDFCGVTTLYVISELLTAIPKLDVSILSAKSWCRKDRQELKRLRRIWPERRLGIRSVCGRDALAREFHVHDWVVHTGVRSDFGSYAALALSCGAPFVAHDIEPYNEIVTNMRNGVLIGCEVRRGPAMAPIAVPLSGHWLAVCGRLFSDNQHLFAMQTKDWHLDKTARSFESAWRALLE